MPFGPFRTVSVVAILVLCLLSLFSGWRMFTQDIQYRRLVTEVGFWGREGYTPTASVLEATARDLDTLLKQSPVQPDYLSLRATVYSWQAHGSEDIDERIVLGNRAMQAQYASLQARPAHRHTWLKMVQYASRATTGAPNLALAEERLQRLGLDDGEVDAVYPRSVR